ncbi:uncharacterized protein TRAVEDRAFT_27083 [Trametes versicolor FP-101664 SS1]|uniref:uncharacterized protein n=1 Tax=Trametes versicolor (strain FP-101664) TaxID=717944 RepID=UPI0004622996|nr:uncharacterized protein TRAVEDRAFT_27083 [Trametes versicolor FP-101664 SS1]EIW61486.1 hypothetical protein TRAVEDRAFT_27083 [Trametes versicolor FP-101664 SS1]
MSSDSLRVELPAYSHSFQVNAPPQSTIRDVKQEIARVCPGSPSPEGQRLVFKGRFLNDDQKVEDVWKSPDDSRVVHLAVHPSAWTAAPPTLSPVSQAASPASPSTPTAQRPPVAQPRLYPQPPRSAHASPAHYPSAPVPVLAFIQHLHNLSLSVLSDGAIALPSQPTTSELGTWRAASVNFYVTRGWEWPAVFDEPFPSGSPEQGAVYEPVTIEGMPYLSLTTPNAVPTPAQAHALKVLSHSFSVLSIANDPFFYAPSTPYPAYQNTPTANLNQRLQELGFPPLRLIPDQNLPGNGNDAAAGAEIRAIPVRALLVPLLMLAFRTLLLLYFFSPSKRPLFGILLSAWIVYEAWNAMRLVLNDGHERRDDPAAANPAAPNGAPAQGGAAAAPAGPAPVAVNRNPSRTLPQAVLNRLAMINLNTEEALLDTDTQQPPPGIVQKAKTFVTLFLLTLHPAAWDRRRTALRRREGRIRTEANAREAAMTARAERESAGEDAPPLTPDEQVRAAAQEQIAARHERRPAWVKEYVQRVQYSEWVDDP